MINSVRPTTSADIPALPVIERAAGQRFQQAPGLQWIAQGPVISADCHQHYAQQKMSWVVEHNDQPCGFLLAQAQSSTLFIVEISVHQACQGLGLGRQLISYVAAQAKAQGFTSLTLTTFRDVPWNAPWYARMGVEILPEDPLSTALRQKLMQEVAHGMAYESRCAMRLMLN